MKILKQIAIVALICSGSAAMAMETEDLERLLQENDILTLINRLDNDTLILQSQIDNGTIRPGEQSGIDKVNRYRDWVMKLRNKVLLSPREATPELLSRIEGTIHQRLEALSTKLHPQLEGTLNFISNKVSKFQEKLTTLQSDRNAIEGEINDLDRRFRDLEAINPNYLSWDSKNRLTRGITEIRAILRQLEK